MSGELERKYEVEILTHEEKQKLEETEKKLFELNRHKILPRHKVLLSEMTLASKAKIIEFIAVSRRESSLA